MERQISREWISAHLAADGRQSNLLPINGDFRIGLHCQTAAELRQANGVHAEIGPDIRTFERDIRAAFLEGYLKTSDADAAEFLPEDPTHVRQLITLFEAEKAFYELAYELNNRPSWMWIPMRGITKLFVA